MGGRWLALGTLAWALVATNGAAHGQDAQAVLDARCAACHERTAEGGLARISEVRKTPEGWDMTIARMMIMHGVEVTPDERHALVKYLADTQGLAPAETKDFRYILERRPGVIETPPTPDLGTMCARCHSWARTALQRRTEDDWLKHMHFHLGQFPTIEYQALGRDRNWWDIASKELPPKLAELFPLKTPEWDGWKGHASPDLSGEWRFVGHTAGQGDYQGKVTIASQGKDTYAYKLRFAYDDGKELEGTGNGILYTGYEWRSRTTVGDQVSLDVFEVSEDGNRMTGRDFAEDADAIGGPITVVREQGSHVLAVHPPYLKAGESAQIAIHGVGLAGDVNLGDGVEVDKVVSADPDTVVVQASAAPDADAGVRAVKVGGTATQGLFTVYHQIDRVTVEPAYTIARVGDNGGPLPPVPAQFDAIGWDGNLRIGPVPATFTVGNFDQAAAELDDAKFAGEMQPNGLFMPAGAGPNPKRPFHTNNAGNLKVIATVQDSGQTVTGEGQLLVTVQRWNDPPIR
jgi:quinohemoprotein amine dehydrogenase